MGRQVTFFSLHFSHLSSPDECPFNCEYHGPPCCPFLGQPTCLPPCNTLVPCHRTPCPDECKDDCFYPNADRCCPKQGQPVCRSELKDGGSSKFMKRSAPGGSTSPDPSTQAKNNSREICVDMIVPWYTLPNSKRDTDPLTHSFSIVRLNVRTTVNIPPMSLARTHTSQSAVRPPMRTKSLTLFRQSPR